MFGSGRNVFEQWILQSEESKMSGVWSANSRKLIIVGLPMKRMDGQ